jgi:hypothetical protein
MEAGRDSRRTACETGFSHERREVAKSTQINASQGVRRCDSDSTVERSSEVSRVDMRPDDIFGMDKRLNQVVGRSAGLTVTSPAASLAAFQPFRVSGVQRCRTA